MRSTYVTLALVALGAVAQGQGKGSARPRLAAGYVRAHPAASGTRSPEDLMQIPGTGWVIVSSMRAADGHPGHLYVVDAEHAGAPMEIYPTARPAVEAGGSAACSTPPDPSVFFPHGINMVRLPDGSFELYVVNHGGREAIEIFRVDLMEGHPRAAWTGCVPMPAGSFGNGIAPVPGGGFVVSNMYDPTDPEYLKKFATGAITGEVLRWSSGVGWRRAVEQPFSGANGVEVSADGRWLYVSEWSARRLWKLPLRGSGKAVSVALDFLPDNLRWTDHGTLLLTGQNARAEEVFGCEARGTACPMAFKVVEVEPENLHFDQLVSEGDREFGGGTGAALIGDELWVGSFQGDQVARYIRSDTKAR